jgi:ribosomal-protein-alanine N-acetyltransferase
MSRQRPVEIALEEPDLRHAEAFLEAVERSRKLHGRWANPPDTPEGYRAYLLKLGSDREAGYLVITEAGNLAGAVNLNEIVMGDFKSAYLGYYAFYPYAGRGYMTAGVKAVIHRAFTHHGLHRLEANIQPENRMSIQLVQRLGFHREGLSRRYLKIGGRWRDHERWAILAEDLDNQGVRGGRTG